MAHQEVNLDKEKLCCSICLDILKDPVIIPCGHSHCMNCIKSYWDEEDKKGTHSCPQCRQIFTPRPALVKNTLLADLVEELKKTGLQAAPFHHCYAGPEDVACDICTGIKLKAIKSCLQCLVSFCDQHLQPHYESPAFEKHTLVDPTKKLQENICARHNEVMKIFCRTDHQCICYLCSMDEHKVHDTVPAAAERTEKQREVEASRQKIQQRIRDREEDSKTLQQKVEAINCSADKAMKDSEKILTDLKQQIKSRQKSQVTHIGELQEKLEQEIAQLRSKDAELEQLSLMKDHIQFLHSSYTLLSHLSEATEAPSFMCHLMHTEPEDVIAAVSAVRDKVQDLLGKAWTKPLVTVTKMELKIKDELLQYSCQITLDENTAHRCVRVEDVRKAVFWDNEYSCYAHPDRFTDWTQVLCRENLTRRCYWEVKWTGREVFIAVAYKNMNRAGRESAFGNNDKSWALQCFSDGYEFRHNNIRTTISGFQDSTIGVFLDHSAGILSFYTAGSLKTLLYTVQTTFTQPLCAGFGMFFDEVSVEIKES